MIAIGCDHVTCLAAGWVVLHLLPPLVQGEVGEVDVGVLQALPRQRVLLCCEPFKRNTSDNLMVTKCFEMGCMPRVTKHCRLLKKLNLLLTKVKNIFQICLRLFYFVINNSLNAHIFFKITLLSTQRCCGLGFESGAKITVMRCSPDQPVPVEVDPHWVHARDQHVDSKIKLKIG